MSLKPNIHLDPQRIYSLLISDKHNTLAIVYEMRESNLLI